MTSQEGSESALFFFPAEITTTASSFVLAPNGHLDNESLEPVASSSSSSHIPHNKNAIHSENKTINEKLKEKNLDAKQLKKHERTRRAAQKKGRSA